MSKKIVTSPSARYTVAGVLRKLQMAEPEDLYSYSALKAIWPQPRRHAGQAREGVQDESRESNAAMLKSVHALTETAECYHDALLTVSRRL